MQNSNDNMLSRLLKSMHVMSQYVPRIRFNDLEDAKQQANNLPYLTPSSPIATFGSQSNPLGLAKNTSPLPDVSSSLRSAGRKPDVPFSVPSLPVATFGSQPNPLDLSKDMEPLPNAIETSDLASLQPKRSQLPEPISPVEPQQFAQPQQSTVPHQDAGSQQSFWDYLRSPEFLQRLSDYGIGYALSDGTIAQSLANAAMNLRRGDMEREKRGQVNQTVEYLKSKGYSEEEARFMAGNKDALNAFLLQKVNGGYDARSKEEMDRLRETIDLKNSEAISSNTLHDIERFMNYIEENGDWATGNLADWQASFKVPQHRDMRSLLDSIKNRIGIDRLETMRRYSRNGASGFGNLTERELDILKSYLGEIKYDLGHKELLFRLKKIHQILAKMKLDVLKLLEDSSIELTQESVDKVTSQSHSKAPQQGHSANAPVVKSAEEIEALPKGADFIVIDADGKRMTIRK
ncbi:hypothetical protein [Bartonella sp. AA126HLJHH]|uniref:hypothetical protein n=1 Tax=Bartonella sp. AA126HLJHH TaxID=3243426 RepID=UPI0035D0E54B